MKNNIVNRFTTNAFWIMVGRIFQIVLTFITTMLVTRYLGPTQYGQITLTFSYVALFVPLATLGLNDILVKELLNNKEDNEEIIGTTIVLRLLSSLLSVIIIYLVVKVMSDNPVLPLVALLQAFLLIFRAFECITFFYQSRLLSKKVGIINIVAYSLTAIFRIICLIIKKDIYWFAFAVTLDYVVIAILLVFVFLKDGNKIRFSKKYISLLLEKSRPYIFSGIMTVIAGKIDTIMIGKFIDETSVGYYGAATTLCNAWPFVLIAIIDSASPIIIDSYDNDREMYTKRLKQLYASIFYIGVLVALIFTVFSKQIITIVYGTSYLEAHKALKIVCWNTIFSYFGVARFIWMQSENKYKYERVITFFGALFNVILNYILINKYGIIGASITFVLTQFFMNFLILFFIKDTRENARLILDAIILKNIK